MLSRSMPTLWDYVVHPLICLLQYLLLPLSTCIPIELFLVDYCQLAWIDGTHLIKILSILAPGVARPNFVPLS
jgi:hypothetical protein